MQPGKFIAILCALSCPLIAGQVIAQPIPGGSYQSGAPAPDFQAFRRPEIIKALHDGDMATLRQDRIGTFRYLQPIVEEFAAPELWYRTGQEIQVMLDPHLAPIMRGISASDEDVMRANLMPAFKGLSGMLIGLATARQQNVEQGRFDPIGEMAAANKGLISGANDLAILKADAQLEARNLILLAQYDPESFLQIYGGIRQFVYSF